MKSLLVFVLAFAAVAAEEEAASAADPKLEIKPLLAAGLAAPYAYPTYAAGSPLVYSAPQALAQPLTYTYQPVVQKVVEKEVEVPVTTYEFAPKETGCTNAFGHAVPCRTRRDAEEEAAPAAEPKLEINPLLAAYPYAAYPYAGYPLAYAAGVPAVTVKAAEPVVQEVEVAKPVLKYNVEKIELLPACQNAYGFPVPCADIA